MVVVTVVNRPVVVMMVVMCRGGGCAGPRWHECQHGDEQLNRAQSQGSDRARA
jgi:hypothetical protein